MVSFDCLWNSFCSPWDDFGLPFGSLWGALGSQGALLGVTLVPLGFPWAPWGHLWHLGLPRAAWDDLGSKVDVQFRANGSQVARLRTKNDLAKLSGVSALWAQSGAGAAAPRPTSLAPGARMTAVKHTPSNYIYNMHIMYKMYNVTVCTVCTI